jgi:23S rRNA pseudouridine1911/1915/1917 synthase
MEPLTLFAEEENAGERLDLFIAGESEDLTRAAARKLTTEGLVSVRGKAVKASYRLKTGDVISVVLPDPRPVSVEPENIPISVIYEDDCLIVVDKPKGMVVHPAPGHSGGTLVNALLYHCRGELSGINGIIRPGIVHRIDKDTTGVLVAAKTDLAHRKLAEQLAAHSVKRLYRAVVHGRFKDDSGIIDKPIGRDPRDRKRMAVTPTGRRAVTRFAVLERFSKFTFIEAELETGRTHQIRVHMSSVGRPLLGDTVYGSDKQPFNTEGQTLHAGVLGFRHPLTGEFMEFSSDLPPYFSAALRKLRA